MVLGHHYDIAWDMLLFPMTIQVHPKRRNLRTGVPITLENKEALDSITFTPRNVLGITNSLYDPAGLTSPWSIKFRILLKKLHEDQHRHLQWDDPVPSHLAKEWKSLIISTLQLTTLEFHRSVQPEDATGQPTYTRFWDASLLACSLLPSRLWPWIWRGSTCEGPWSIFVPRNRGC